jgi:hypothetical protein
MTYPGESAAHARESAGPWKDPGAAGQEPALRDAETARFEAVPPEERKEAGSRGLVAPVVRMIVVQDENGQTVSVTRVAPDAKFGVGVKPPPGHTVKEYEAGTLAEDPFGGSGMREPGQPGDSSE